MEVRELMISLGCGSRVEMVQVVKELVEKASVLEEVQKCTGWADEDLVRECSELERKLTSLSRKNNEILSLQRQLEERQREIDHLRAEQAAEKKGLPLTDETIPEEDREDNGLRKLRRLKKAEAQTVAEYCVELERLSARAYPELDEKALVTTRAQQLYEQIVHWPESYYFLGAMEKEGPSAYESLKEAAMRVERRRLTLESARAQSYQAAGERLESTSRHERARAPAKMEKSIKRDENNNRRRSELPNKEKEESRHKEKGGHMQRFNCRGKGHLASECKGRRVLGSKATEVSLEQTKPPSPPEKRCPSRVVPPFGKKSVTSLTIFGNVWSALLDAGSEILILPQKVLQRIEEEAHRLQECPIDLRKRILDASGNRMKFLKVVEVPLKGGTGTEITLQVHVSVQKGHMLVLGTNALEALNYTLVRRSGEDCKKGEVAEEALVKPSQEARSASKATM
ncbi:unnamed protein product [Haemonchus placei]|uniref:Reverse transcriptase n=1 Tax=Haemonchus placei TaxID=6290 RepID=A0A0N4W1W4_HAEPC|nr:unnamed protein product [Haemonchus placei]